MGYKVCKPTYLSDVTERNSGVTARFLCVTTSVLYDDLANIKQPLRGYKNIGGHYYDIWGKD